MPPFDPLVERWFRDEVGSPTPLQREAWDVIGGGSHALVTAPTGSGKTMAAFLSALDRLVTGAWPAGTTRVLYVSPLRALNNDIRENLIAPLAGLERRLAAAGRPWPGIRVAVRSGDTPDSERRAQLRHPAEILITTPESLAILLSTIDGREMLKGLRTVILDEIHAVAATRRGVHLLSSLERITLLAGEVQRIALSATVKPLERVAGLIGGFLPDGRARRVEIVADPSAKQIRLSVHVAEPRGREATVWDALAEELRGPIAANRSTLVFANSRRAAEKIARLLNDPGREPVAYSHHGSLSRELRAVVEKRMREGTLAAIVATNSLELGIDIGALDEVILVQTPPSVASALQRIGRAGHRIGEESRARLYPLHGRDLLEAAAMAEAVREQDIEEVRPPASPLDVAAQVVLALCAVETWRLDDLHAFLRRITPFRDLTRESFAAVLDMLSGRVGPRRVRDLPVRLLVDEAEGTARAADGVAALLRISGGTIPDRGVFTLRLEAGGTRIGDLDEEFVWERKAGDTFGLGAQSWVIRRIDDQQVFVAPAPDKAGFSPFWRADPGGRDFRFAERVGRLLERLDTRLEDPAAAEELAATMGGSREAAGALLATLRLQRQVTGCGLPHRRHLVLEHVADPAGYERRGKPSGVTSVTVVHTFWGGRVNRTLALLLADALEERTGARATVYHDEAAVMVGVPAGTLAFGAEELLALARPEEVERRVTARLLSSGLFGARFREAAQISLLLPRPGPRRRLPLWLARLRARRLLEAVRDAGAFPLVAEALRASRGEDCDLPTLRDLLGELQRGEIRMSEARTASASPFASGLVWQQTGTFMYQDDTPWRPPEASIYREVIGSSDLRPSLDPELVASFEERLRRLAPGYAPADARELEDWAAERLLIPAAEWESLLAACERDARRPRGDLLAQAAPRLASLESGGERFVLARRSIPRLRRALGPIAPAPLDDPDGAIDAAGPAGSEEDFLAFVEEWIAFSGPFPPGMLAAAAGRRGLSAAELVDRLLERDSAVAGALVRGGPAMLVCDRTNLERLLALARRAARPALAPQPAKRLALFVAAAQGVARREAAAAPAAGPAPAPERAVAAALDPLFGYPLPAGLWETAVLPARVPGYRPAWLDSLLHDTDLIWLGVKKERLTFCLEQERSLWSHAKGPAEPLFPDPGARYGFWELAERTGLASAELTGRLWRLAWDGLATTDSFAAVRRGAAVGFEAAAAAEPAGAAQPAGAQPAAARRGRRLGFDRWLTSRPADGAWLCLPPAPQPRDAVEEAQADDDLIYQLLDRYGIVFRALLAWELPHVRWGRLFRRLRVLELAGEVVGGVFFEGIEGPQFVSPAGLRALGEGLPEDAFYWMSAADPASLCGIGVGGLALPRRLAGTMLAYAGADLLLVARREGAEVEITVAPDDPRLAGALRSLGAIVTREVRPVRLLRVERINGKAAGASPYKPVFAAEGFRDEGRALSLRPELLWNRR